jgi:hypothetical protein
MLRYRAAINALRQAQPGTALKIQRDGWHLTPASSTSRIRMHHFVGLPAPETSGNDSTVSLNPEHTKAVKRWTHEYLRLPDDAVVSVSEFACSDPGCPLLETVIVVFDAGTTRTWKLTRPRAAVTKLMLQQTLATPPEVRATPAPSTGT